MAYSVYVLRDINGKVYVGATSQPLEKRWANGNGYRFHSELWSTICQYGWESITKEVVAVGLNKTDASLLEQATILKYDATNPEKGYNRELGGLDSDKTVTDSMREHMRDVTTGERNHNYGKPRSEEVKAKIAASNRGKKRSAETRMRVGKAKEKAVAQYSKSGVLIAVYESGTKAAEATGADNRHISKVCRHLRATAGGYRWEYA